MIYNNLESIYIFIFIFNFIKDCFVIPVNLLDIPMVVISSFSAGVPPVGSIVVNASSEAPMVTMRILNEDNKDALVTQLGQKLTLRIEISPVNGRTHSFRLINIKPPLVFSWFLFFIEFFFSILNEIFLDNDFC